jgi:multisubunit Na+/H+ antiporter MnhG subunit
VTNPVVLVLLACTVITAWLGAGGLLLLRTPHDRLHIAGFLSVATGAGATLAVIAANPLSASAVKACIILVALIALNAVLTHAIARALWLRAESGDLS